MYSDVVWCEYPVFSVDLFGLQVYPPCLRSSVKFCQVSEVAAGPGKSKKAGAPVDTEEFYKVMDAIEYPGDPDRLLRHLDPGNVGYANTRTLRILNEQRSEEKAVPQFLKKYAENRQALLEQKIASVVIPPAKELLAKQDSLRESCLEEQNTKKETRIAKEEFLRKLTSKFGSASYAARCWERVYVYCIYSTFIYYCICTLYIVVDYATDYVALVCICCYMLPQHRITSMIKNLDLDCSWLLASQKDSARPQVRPSFFQTLYEHV